MSGRDSAIVNQDESRNQTEWKRKMTMEFIVREMSSKSGTLYVRYDCACGCKPSVEHQRGSQEVEYEHCCCGNVQFVGQDARQQLDQYIERRRAEGLDEDLGGYSVSEAQLATPWGTTVTIAYAIPANARAH